MSEIILASLIFLALSGAALGTRNLTHRLHASHVSEETHSLVRLVANLFVVVTSLVFGLLINSSRANFETLDNQVHTYATQLILLDRTLEAYGPEAGDARNNLQQYLRIAIASPARANADGRATSTEAEDALRSLGRALLTISPTDSGLQSLRIRRRPQLLMPDPRDDAH